MTSATIALFSYDERPYLSCVRSIVRDVPQHGDWAIMYASKDALISRMRSKLASQYLDQGTGDVLVMVDQDMSWEAGDLDHLVDACARTKGVVAGIYAIRDFGQSCAVRLRHHDEVTVGANDQLAEAEYVSTGFMAIHRSVLERMAETMPRTIHHWWPFFATMLEPHPGGYGEEYLSEDWAFVLRARRLGVPILADLWPRLSHAGMHHYRLVDAVYQLPPSGQIHLKSTSPDDLFPLGRWQVKLPPQDQIISPAIRKHATWEPAVVDELCARGGGTLWDIGSYIGTVAIQCSDAFAEIVAFEPLAHDALAENIKINQLTNIAVVPSALVPNGATEMRMLQSINNPGSSFRNTGLGGRVVPAIGITAALDTYGVPDAIKMDVEGDELLLLEADPRMLSVPLLVVEYCDDQSRRQTGRPASDIVRLLREHGYHVGLAGHPEVDIDAPGVLPVGAPYTNIVAVRE